LTRTRRPTRPTVVAAVVSVAAVLTAGSPSLSADAAGSSGHRGGSLRADLVARADGHARFAVHGRRATFFATAPGYVARRPQSVSASAKPAAAARGWMASYGPVFGLPSAARDLHVTAASQDGGGAIVRLQQTVDGVPVLGGGYSVALDARNDLVSIVGKSTPLATRGPVVIPRAAARHVAVATVRRSEPSVGPFAASRPHLRVLDQSLFGAPTTVGPTTVWVVDVSTPDRIVHHRVFLDVVHGRVILDLNENAYATPQPHRVVCRPAAGNDRRIDNPGCHRPSHNSEVKVIAWEANPPARTNKDAYNAFRFAKAVWQFYWKVLGRDSLDGRGMPLGSTVHYCPPRGSGSCAFDNAFWDGHEMVYGAGYTSALDVVGHEMTHGVTQHTSHLLSYYQSGAIDESMSDTMGELIQQIAGPALHAYSASKPWRVGEQLPIGAVRRMDHPEAFGDPNAMQSSSYSAAPMYSARWDNGGVHSNAGIGNKAAFLIAAGPNGNGSTASFNHVTMAGVAPHASTASAQRIRDVKTANIYYRLERLMASAATYADLYDLLPQACKGLVGRTLRVSATKTTSLTLGDCDQVQRAVDATQMNLQPTRSGAIIPVAAVPSCDNGGIPTTVRRDRFESNPLNSGGSYTRGQSTTRDSSGLKAFGSFWWSNTYIDYYASRPSAYQQSGSKASLYGDDADPRWLDPSGNRYDRQDSWVQMNTGVPVDAGTQMVFKHAWEFDYGPDGFGGIGAFDGGQVYYSLDGGTWRNAGPLFTENGYNGTIANVAGDRTNPMRGQQGFVASSHGWTASKLDLSPLAGHHVRLRWRIGGDSVAGSLGWYVDDVQVYTCAATMTTLTSDATSVPAGNPVNLTAHAVLRGTAQAVPDGSVVQFFSRDPGSTVWNPVGGATTSAGDAQMAIAPTSNQEYQARLVADSAAGVNASESLPLEVDVT